MINLAYVTTNIAPFRVLLLDKLSKYFESISLVYFKEIEEGTKREYVNKRSDRIRFVDFSKLSFKEQRKNLRSYDYVIFDGYTGKNKNLLMLYLRLKHIKYGISIDGIIPKKERNALKIFFKRILLKGSDLVFSTNHLTDQIIKNIYPRANVVRHIFTTLTLSDFKFIDTINTVDVKNRYHLDLNKKTILFVGKFVETKGVYEFIEFANLHANLYNFVCVGGKKSDLNTTNIDENILFINFAEKDEILSLMKMSDLFVLPTYTDVWGLVVVEALSCGIPVVSTNQCNASIELIANGKNGFRCDYYKKNDLFAAIENALSMNKSDVKRYNDILMKSYNVETAAEKMYKEINKLNG